MLVSGLSQIFFTLTQLTLWPRTICLYKVSHRQTSLPKKFVPHQAMFQLLLAGPSIWYNLFLTSVKPFTVITYWCKAFPSTPAFSPKVSSQISISSTNIFFFMSLNSSLSLGLKLMVGLGSFLAIGPHGGATH